MNTVFFIYSAINNMQEYYRYSLYPVRSSLKSTDSLLLKWNWKGMGYFDKMKMPARHDAVS